MHSRGGGSIVVCLSPYQVLFIEISTECCESRGGVITRGSMVGDGEDLTAKMVLELNLEVGWQFGG